MKASEAEIAAAVRALPPGDRPAGLGRRLAAEAITWEADRTGLPPERVREIIFLHGCDCDNVLAEVRRVQAERGAPP